MSMLSTQLTIDNEQQQWSRKSGGDFLINIQSLLFD